MNRTGFLLTFLRIFCIIVLSIIMQCGRMPFRNRFFTTLLAVLPLNYIAPRRRKTASDQFNAGMTTKVYAILNTNTVIHGDMAHYACSYPPDGRSCIYDRYHYNRSNITTQ